MLTGLVAFLFIIALSDSRKCSTSTCVGHYKLQHSKGISINLTGTEYISRVMTIPERIKGYLFSRKRFYNYYYDGGDLDPNTIGYPTYDEVPVSNEELSLWIESGKCTYGEVCCPGSQCYGSDAVKCLSPDRNVIVNKATEKKFQCAGATWSIFAKHTCVLDWDCFIKEIYLPLHICSGKICTTLENGTEIIIDPDDKFITRIPLKNGVELAFSELNKVKVQPRKETCRLDCYVININESVCVVKSPCTSEKTILKTCSNGKICSRYSYASLTISIISPETHDSNRREKRMKRESDASASKEDVWELEKYVQGENIRQDINMVNLVSHINKIEDIILKMINYLGAHDNFIIGSISGKTFLTKFLSEDQFTMCPCEKETVQLTDVCSKDSNDTYIYSGGEYKKWDKKEKCFKPARIASPYQIISDYNYKADDIREPDIIGASFQWEGWQWLTEYKDGLFHAMSVSSVLHQSPLFDYLSSPLYNPIFSFWTSIVSHSGLIALGLSLFNCVRRR